MPPPELHFAGGVQRKPDAEVHAAMADYKPPHPPLVPNWMMIVGTLGVVAIVVVIVVVVGMAIEAAPSKAGTPSSSDASVPTRSSYVGGGNARPSGVTDYGWDNWRQLSDDEQRRVCAAMKNVFEIEANAARVAIESGASLPARAAEPAETADMRLLCNVPAPDYQQMRSDRVRQEAREEAEREALVRDRYDKMYRELRPGEQILLCVSFKSAGGDSFTYNRVALNNFVTRTGWEPISGTEDVQHLEAVCRRHRDRR